MGHSLRLADVLGGLSIVADLGFGLPSEEAMRSCLIGTALARELGVAEPEVADTFYACLLVHIGCTAFSHETAAVFGDELQNTRAVARTNFADPREVLTRFVPEATHADSPATAESHSERENLPEELEAGVTYRDFAVRWRVAARLNEPDWEEAVGGDRRTVPLPRNAHRQL